MFQAFIITLTKYSPNSTKSDASVWRMKGFRKLYSHSTDDGHSSCFSLSGTEMDAE